MKSTPGSVELQPAEVASVEDWRRRKRGDQPQILLVVGSCGRARRRLTTALSARASTELISEWRERARLDVSCERRRNLLRNVLHLTSVTPPCGALVRIQPTLAA